MPKETPLELRLGTDHSFKFAVLNSAETAAIDITGWTLSFMIKRFVNDLDATALLTLTTSGGGITISGTFNPTPSVNTQRAAVAIADTQTDAIEGGFAQWELKRTNTGVETILAYGQMSLLRTLHRT